MKLVPKLLLVICMLFVCCARKKKCVAKATLRLGNIGRASNGIFIVHASKKHHLILDDFLDAVRSKRIHE
jgi:hypothetical protein